MYNIFIIHDLSDHSTHPWLLRDQGLLPTTSPRSLTSINKKWVSRIGLAGYPKVVNTQHPLSCLNFLFLSFFLSFSLSFSFFSLYQFIGLCGSPKSAAKSPSSLLLIGMWLPNTKKKNIIFIETNERWEHAARCKDCRIVNSERT